MSQLCLGENLTLDNPGDSVSHVVGSSAQKGNWKHFWEQHTGRRFGTCQTLGCSADAMVGAHVSVSTRTLTYHAYMQARIELQPKRMQKSFGCQEIKYYKGQRTPKRLATTSKYIMDTQGWSWPIAREKSIRSQKETKENSCDGPLYIYASVMCGCAGVAELDGRTRWVGRECESSRL